MISLREYILRKMFDEINDLVVGKKENINHSVSLKFQSLSIIRNDEHTI